MPVVNVFECGVLLELFVYDLILDLKKIRQGDALKFENNFLNVETYATFRDDFPLEERRDTTGESLST
jgi:hypothetical protein